MSLAVVLHRQALIGPVCRFLRMINGLYRIGANSEFSELEKSCARDRQWLIVSAEYTPYSLIYEFEMRR